MKVDGDSDGDGDGAGETEVRSKERSSKKRERPGKGRGGKRMSEFIIIRYPELFDWGPARQAPATVRVGLAGYLGA